MPNPFASQSLAAELRDGTLHLRHGETGEDIPWPTAPDEAPSPEARTRLTEALRRLAPRRAWQSAPVVWCALPARGIVLRPVRVPASAGSEARRVLQMQVEAAFPLPPDELVWGAVPTTGPAATGDVRTVHVAALRRTFLEPLAKAIEDAGGRAIFTVACSVRAPGTESNPSGLRLDIGPRSSELSRWQDRCPVRFRTLEFGTADLSGSDSIPTLIGERLVPAIQQLADGTGALEISIAAEKAAVATAVADAIRIRLPQALVVLLNTPTGGSGRTPATDGLEDRIRSGRTSGVLRLSLGEAEPAAENADRRIPASAFPWLVRAACLGAALLAFPYAEAYFNRPRLKRQLDAIQKERTRLGEIDRRLEFLQHIADNQPPYLDAAYVIAAAAPPGAKLDTLNMNRRGEVSFSGGVQQPQQVVDFRTKLIDSKFFSSVVVEEQALGQQGGGRVTFRMTAQWKAATDREALQLGPEPPKATGTNTPGTNSPAKR